MEILDFNFTRITKYFRRFTWIWKLWQSVSIPIPWRVHLRSQVFLTKRKVLKFWFWGFGSTFDSKRWLDLFKLKGSHYLELNVVSLIQLVVSQVITYEFHMESRFYIQCSKKNSQTESITFMRSTLYTIFYVQILDSRFYIQCSKKFFTNGRCHIEKKYPLHRLHTFLSRS